MATPELGLTLLRSGALVGAVLIIQVLALRRLPAEDIPGVLRGRVQLSVRLRPWLVTAAAAMTTGGILVLFLASVD